MTAARIKSKKYVVQYKPFDDMAWVDYGNTGFYSIDAAERSLRNPRAMVEAELGASYRIIERTTTDTVVSEIR